MLKNLVNKLMGKKTKEVELSNADKIALLSDKALGLVDSFRKTHDELGEINKELRAVADADIQKVIELEKNIDKANDEIMMNKALQAKLAEFIR